MKTLPAGRPGPPERIDQQVLGAGTTLRFVLLLVLFLAASSSMMFDVLQSRVTDPQHTFLGCALAGGLNPDESYAGAALMMVSQYAGAFEGCLDRYLPSPPLPALAVGMALLMLAAVGLYWILPAWKRRRTVPVEQVDVRGEVGPVLAELVGVAGLHRVPEFVVDPAARTDNAVTYGRRGRYTVCLHAGLIVRMSREPEAFRAVVLHELAHLHNRDVDITYLTVALWRVFFTAVLLPYSALELWAWLPQHGSVFASAMRPAQVTELVLSVFMVALVYLSRADLLRTREVYADVKALGWGADPMGWRGGVQPPAGSDPLRNALAALTEIWRTHPRWARRWQTATDPSALFGIQPVPMFLTGAAAAITAGELQTLSSSAATAEVSTEWMNPPTAWLVAALITGVAGVALWRSHLHAALTSRKPPSGPITGLWIGSGVLVGQLLLYPSGPHSWLPRSPTALAPLALACVFTAAWTGEYAELWIWLRWGRSLKPIMWLGLATAWAGLAAILTWWLSTGLLWASGSPFSTRGIRHWLSTGIPEITAHPTLLRLVTGMLPYVESVRPSVLVMAAATAMWLVPLLAWSVHRGRQTPSWALRALSPARPQAPLPAADGATPMRGLLWIAVSGGIASWPAVLLAMASLRSWVTGDDQSIGRHALVVRLLLLAIVGAAALVTSFAAGTLASGYRLLSGLIAGSMAALTCLLGTFVLLTAPDCYVRLSGSTQACGWEPGAAWQLVAPLLPCAVAEGFVMAAAGALIALPARRLWRMVRPGPPARAARGTGVPRMAYRRAAVALACLMGAGMATAGCMVAAGGLVAGTSSDAREDTSGQLAATLGTSPSPYVRAVQLAAWSDYGGSDLLDRMAKNFGRFGAVLKSGSLDPAQIVPDCEEFGRTARKGEAYFPPPDPQLRPTWSDLLGHLKEGSSDCGAAIADADSGRFEKALDQFTGAGQDMTAFATRLKEAMVQGACGDRCPEKVGAHQTGARSIGSKRRLSPST